MTQDLNQQNELKKTELCDSCAGIQRNWRRAPGHAELVPGAARPESVAYFQQVIARLKEEGCDAVILGCTEIPLIISDANSALPTLDSTRLLARAALRRAVAAV